MTVTARTGEARTARAARIAAPMRVEIVEVNLDAVGPGSVRVEVERSGVCGTDLKMFRGGEVLRPHLFGHEWSGRVAEVGEAIRSVAVGDRVVVSVPGPCGACAQCLRGNERFCVAAMNVVGGRDIESAVSGGLATSVVVPDYRVLRARPELTAAEAGMVEPASVALRGVEACRLRLGDTVVILGGGAIGLFALQIARAAGAGTCLVVEPDPHRRELAVTLGADMAAAPEDAATSIGAATEGLGADVVIECSGRGEAVQEAVLLCRRGGTMGLLGFAPGDAVIQPATWIAKEISVIASAGYSRADQIKVMDLMVAGRIDVTPLHSRSVGLEELQETLNAMVSGPTSEVKVLVVPNDS